MPGANDAPGQPIFRHAHDVVADFRNPAPHRSLARRVRTLVAIRIVLEYGDGPEVMAAVCVHGEDAAAQGMQAPFRCRTISPHRALYLAPDSTMGLGFEHHAFRNSGSPRRYCRITDSC